MDVHEGSDLEPLPQELRAIRIEAALGDLCAFISKAAQRLGKIAPPH